MWSIALYDLGLTSDQFYAMTPRQFDALVKRKERETQSNEFLFAQLTSYLVNFSMCRPKEPVAPRDFMPSEWGKAKPENKQKRVRLTKKRQKAITETFRAGFAALRARKR